VCGNSDFMPLVLSQQVALPQTNQQGTGCTTVDICNVYDCVCFIPEKRGKGSDEFETRPSGLFPWLILATSVDSTSEVVQVKAASYTFECLLGALLTTTTIPPTQLQLPRCFT
jgi:hypothetical protein